MAIRSSSSTSYTGSGNFTITGTKPTGSVAGDRLLVWIVTDGNPTVTAPVGEGWSLLATASTAAPADVNKAFVYEKKVSDGAETFAWTLTIGKQAIIQVVALTGRHTSTAAVVSTPTITNTSAASPLTVAVSGVTAVAADDVLWFGQIDQVGRFETWSFGAIGGYTQLQNAANNDYISAASFGAENVSAGATGTLTSTATRLTGSSNGSWSGVVVSIPTGASGPTVTTVTTPGTTEAGNMVFTASLSGATSGSTNYAFTLGGTATAGTDYTSPLTSAMCSNGVTVVGSDFVVPTAVSSWTVTIPTTSDTLNETNETIILTIGGVASTGGTITDDDVQPTVTISDATEVGGTVTFVATLSAASGKTVSFNYATANGTKVAGVDYTAATGTVTFAPGETSKNIVITAL